MMTRGQEQELVVFGEVLFDCFPEGSVVLGGAPFNVAWHLQAFGAAPLFISRVGDDPLGHRIRDTMHNWEMNTAGLQLDSTYPTGRVDITLGDDGHSFNILADQAYDFIDAAALPPLPGNAMLYHGSLALRNEVSRHTLQALNSQGDMPVFLDVNLREPWWRQDFILSLIETARWVKLNDEELALLVPDKPDLQSRMQSLCETTALDLLIVTRGAAGAVVLTDGGRELSIMPAGQARIVDTVGAGDAFTSVLLLGLMRDWELPLVLERAQAFASAIVGVRGATVADASFYRCYIQQWDLA